MPATVVYRVATPPDGDVRSLEAALCAQLERPRYRAISARCFDGPSSKYMILTFWRSLNGGLFLDIVSCREDNRVSAVDQNVSEEAVSARMFTDLPTGHAPINSSAFFLVRENHIAALESSAINSSKLQAISNTLLGFDLSAPKGARWHIGNRARINLDNAPLRNVRKLSAKPKALLGGTKPYEPAPNQEEAVRQRALSQKTQGLLRNGGLVRDALIAFGFDGAALEDLQRGMSEDVAITAKVELSLTHLRSRSVTGVLLPTETVNEILANVDRNAMELEVQDVNGKRVGNIAEMSNRCDLTVDQSNPDLRAIDLALAEALNHWQADGLIG
jgi:hypothetical protein